MGYRGKVVQQEQARRLRALGYTYNEIVAELGVAKSSVSLWCRDVEVDEEAWQARSRANYRYGNAVKRRNAMSARKEAEIEACRVRGVRRIGGLSDRDLLIAGIALYAGEGAKRDGSVKFANSDPAMIALFMRFLRAFFDIDESRLRVRLYLHEGLDLDEAMAFWSELTDIPLSQFTKPYRATPDPSIRKSKHPMGCPAVAYSCSHVHRELMGLVRALLA